MIFDSEHLMYKEDRLRVSSAMEATMLTGAIIWANDLYKAMGSKKRIDIDIIIDASKAMLTDQPFTDEEILRFFTTMQDLEDFSKMVEKFNEMELYLSYELEFVLLGVPLKTQLANEEKAAKIHEKRGSRNIQGMTAPQMVKELKQLAKEFKA